MAVQCVQGQAQQQHHHQQLQHLQMSQQLQDGPRPGMQLSGLGTSNLRPGENWSPEKPEPSAMLA